MIFKELKDMTDLEVIDHLWSELIQLRGSFYGLTLDHEYGGRALSFDSSESVREEFRNSQMSYISQFIDGLVVVVGHLDRRLRVRE